MALQRFPGFIDVHVHLRDPGAIHKEDFRTGSRSGVKGGFTYMVDMPNNPIPTVSLLRLKEKERLVKKKSLCPIGFHYGTDGKNISTFSGVWDRSSVFGLKIYCNHTTGDLLIEDKKTLDKIFRSWKSQKPILVHAEGQTLERVLGLSALYRRRLHVCHIAKKEEVAMVAKAKKAGHPVTAGVTPHHLFLTSDNVRTLGSFAIMKPPLGTKKDQHALWQGINADTIDVVETDHAPHTREEKKAEKPPFGVPGLETAVGLMFLAAKKKMITKQKVVDLLYHHPKHIFRIPDQKNTYIELDPQKPYIVGSLGYETKCGWSPFDGWKLYGQPQNVNINGKRIMTNGIIKARISV